MHQKAADSEQANPSKQSLHQPSQTQLSEKTSKMKSIYGIALVSIALFAFAAALPGKPRPNNFPRPTSHPRPIRVRRQAIELQANKNPAGGTDGRLDLSAGVGSPKTHLLASGFVEGNSKHSAASHGGQLEINSHGLGAFIGKESIPGGRDTITKGLKANIYSDNVQTLSAMGYTSSNVQPNGFMFDRNGGGVKYEHVDGHGASFGASNIPGIGSQLEAAGKANLYTSPDKNTRLDFTAGGSRWLSGPFAGRNELSTGFGLNHYFG